tara:strand:- start:12 stop:536 length:525 start_codon:yes stop_codon:yes gene_type:complete
MKIYTSNNYFFIDDGIQLFEGLSKDILVRRASSSSETFYFRNVNGFKESTSVDLSNIQKENGSAYALSEFVEFYTLELGKSSASENGAVEVDFSSLPISEKEFDVTNLSVSSSSKIIPVLSYSKPTDKDLDELTMDTINVIAGQTYAGGFKIYVKSNDGSLLSGKFIINYSILK